jgi:hypothetical protein
MLMIGPTESVQADNRRRFGRVRCSGLGCSLGQVVDLSPGGAKVSVRGRLSKAVGDDVTVQLSGYGQAAYTVNAKIVGIRETKRGLFGTRREVRLCFEALPEEAIMTIRGLARTHADTECRVSSMQGTARLSA